MAGLSQDTDVSKGTVNSINRCFFPASFPLKCLKLCLEEVMPSFLLLFEIGSGQLGVLVRPQPSAILDHLVYPALSQSWTGACSWCCCVSGAVPAAAELGLMEAEVCGAGNKPCLG